MAIVAHLVERTTSPGKTFINNIRAVILAVDDATYTSAALIRNRASALCRAAGQDVPDGYFDANRGLAATWNADADITVISGTVVHETIA